mgnify:CR=1 FL=1
MMDRNTGSARRAAKDVYSAIGYDLLYRDGIAQVEEGLFSQTLAFDDISYQSAREENQRAIGVRKPPKLAPMPTAMIISMADLDLSSLEGES